MRNMKRNYMLPRQSVVEIDERGVLCEGSNTDTQRMKVELKDYDTYEEKSTPRTTTVDWDGVGTGSDF